MNIILITIQNSEYSFIDRSRESYFNILTNDRHHHHHHHHGKNGLYLDGTCYTLIRLIVSSILHVRPTGIAVSADAVRQIFPALPLQDTWWDCTSWAPVVGCSGSLVLANQCGQK